MSFPFVFVLCSSTLHFSYVDIVISEARQLACLTCLTFAYFIIPKGQGPGSQGPRGQGPKVSVAAATRLLPGAGALGVLAP